MHVAKMPFVKYLNIMSYVYAQMDSKANQQKVVPNMNVVKTAIARSINIAIKVLAATHVSKVVFAVSMLNVVLLTENLSVRAR